MATKKRASCACVSSLVCAVAIFCLPLTSCGLKRNAKPADVTIVLPNGFFGSFLIMNSTLDPSFAPNPPIRVSLASDEFDRIIAPIPPSLKNATFSIEFTDGQVPPVVDALVINDPPANLAGVSVAVLSRDSEGRPIVFIGRPSQIARMMGPDE